MNFHTFLLYLATWTLVALTPGPAVMYSMATATRYGLRSGVATICGIQAGNCVLFLSVALGLGALLTAHSSALTVLRITGAAYLFWLGALVIARSFKARREAEPQQRCDFDGKSAMQGLLVQVTNPKALLFVTALLPQFIDADRSAVAQLAILVVATVSVDTLVLFAYAVLAHRGAQSFHRSSLAVWCERIYGAALLGFAGRLLSARN